MAKPYDESLKKLVHASPQAFAQWLMADAVFLKELPNELEEVKLLLDALLEVTIHDQHMLLHIEFQTRTDPLMAKRLLWYNVLIEKQYDLPILSFAIYLFSDGPVPQSPLMRTTPIGQKIHDFYFVNVEVGKLSPENILQHNDVGLLPLLPLTEGGLGREVIATMLDTLQNDDDTQGLAVIGYTLAELAMRRKHNPDINWLIRRFKNMHEILRESAIYQEIRQEGREEGREEGQLKASRELLLAIITARFPKLTRLAQTYIATVDNPMLLQNLIVQLVVTNTTKEARELIVSFISNTVDDSDDDA